MVCIICRGWVWLCPRRGCRSKRYTHVGRCRSSRGAGGAELKPVCGSCVVVARCRWGVCGGGWKRTSSTRRTRCTPGKAEARPRSSRSWSTSRRRRCTEAQTTSGSRCGGTGSTGFGAKLKSCFCIRRWCCGRRSRRLTRWRSYSRGPSKVRHGIDIRAWRRCCLRSCTRCRPKQRFGIRGWYWFG